MKIAIIGSNGQLGSDLLQQFAARGSEVTPLSHKDILVEDYSSVSNVIHSLRPDVVLNTAAFHVVPQCEVDPIRSFQVNSLGSLHVAKACSEVNAVSVYYSTDYVFDGKKRRPYVEPDTPNPLNTYAATKLLGEHYTLNYSSNGVVLRISGIYGRVPCRAKGGNFVTSMIKAAKDKPVVKVVQDEILTPTPTAEIARKTYELIRRQARGLFHLTCEGECSWYEFAKAIFENLHIKTPLEACSVQDFPVTVKRPFYSVLENQRIKDLGLTDMPHWRTALDEFLGKEYGPNP